MLATEAIPALESPSAAREGTKVEVSLTVGVGWAPESPRRLRPSMVRLVMVDTKVDFRFQSAGIFNDLPQKMHPRAVTVTDSANEKLRPLQDATNERANVLRTAKMHLLGDTKWRNLAQRQHKVEWKQVCCAQDTNDKMDRKARARLEEHCRYERQQRNAARIEDVLKAAKWAFCCPCAYVKDRWDEMTAAAERSRPPERQRSKTPPTRSAGVPRVS